MPAFMATLTLCGNLFVIHKVKMIKYEGTELKLLKFMLYCSWFISWACLVQFFSKILSLSLQNLSYINSCKASTCLVKSKNICPIYKASTYLICLLLAPYYAWVVITQICTAVSISWSSINKLLCDIR